MDQAARGKKALADGKYDEAITEYTAALKVSPTSPDYLIQRSTAYQRAKKHEEALEDANNAVLNAQKRAKREFIIEGQFRRGCASYSLGRYGDAKFLFSVVKRMDEKHKMVTVWAQKTTIALNKLDEGDENRKCTVTETPTATAKDASTTEDKEAPRPNGATSNSSASAVPQQTPADKVRHEWYQNNQKVYFTLLAKGVPADKTQIDIQERSLAITYPLTNGSSFDFTLEPLFAAILPDKSSFRILSTKIEVTLAKASSGEKWKALESSDSQTETPSTTEASNATSTMHDRKDTALDSSGKTPAYPTSSKTGPKDWDKAVQEANQNLRDVDKTGASGKESSAAEDDDDYEGGDEANHFFKKLFKGASPDMQRAMMKSYTESNGTSLSTDWSEVGKGKVETLPPNGMEAKKW